MTTPTTDSLGQLRRLIWIYFWLLIFEGALRKWLIPSLSGPLLIARDPVVIAIYAMAVTRGVFPGSMLVGWTFGLAAMCFATSFAGIGNLNVTLFGLRANFMHLPLILIIPRVFRQEDVRRMGLALLVVAPLMGVLCVKQFQAGADSRWNVGAGGEIGAQLYAAQGKVRASGTFSFATGLATYLSLCAAFLLNDLLGRQVYPRWVTLSAFFSVVLSLAVSGSRTAVICVTVVCAMVLYMGFRRHEKFGAALRPILLTVVVVAILIRITPLFRQGIAVHMDRFTSGGGLKEGIGMRTANEFFAAWDRLSTAPLLGVGIGVGTSAGAALLHGQREFSLGEGEWERVIMECGPILGVGYILLRLGYLTAIVRTALRGYRHGHALPLLLLGVTGIDFVNGQFGQSTALGFAVLTGGLALAAAGEEEPAVALGALPQTPEPLVFGRSPYARRLHGIKENGNSQ